MISFGLGSGAGDPFELVVVQQPVIAALRHSAARGTICPTGWARRRGSGGRRRRAHPQDGVAGRQQRQEHRLVGLCAGMRLHIGERAAKQPAGALDRQALGDVNVGAAAVVAPAGIALGVFVGQDESLALRAPRRRPCSPRRSARCRPAGVSVRHRSRRRARGRSRPAGGEERCRLLAGDWSFMRWAFPPG